MPTETINSKTVLGRRSFMASEPCEEYVAIGRRSYVGAARTCLHHGSMTVRTTANRKTATAKTNALLQSNFIKRVVS
jgi:hypothetical protein